MKTPRDLLFERHRSAGPKLDAVRNEVLKTLTGGETPRHAGGWSAALRQLFWPHPRAWAALAAVWVVIAVVHFAIDDAPLVATQKAPAPSADIAVALEQQRRLRAELIGQSAALEADRPKSFLLRPRSDQRAEFSFA